MDEGIKEKFESYFIVGSKTKCWNWTGRLTGWGYGHLWYKRKSHIASRVAYELHYKEKPGKKLVCHTCDNPICVNPHHLFLGTEQDNRRDMYAKGRGGNIYTPQKLNEPNVQKIHQYLATGMTTIMIADKFNISPNHVSSIKHGHRWAHVAKQEAGKYRDSDLL